MSDSLRARTRAPGVCLRRLADARGRAAVGALTTVDRAVLHAGLIGGIAYGRVIAPEASRVLQRVVYGDGSELRLDAAYFRRSPYVREPVQQLGPGDHGPIGLLWEPRLTLAFNPLYLSISGALIRIGHPAAAFSGVHDRPVWTLVTVGRMKLRIPDNLVAALGNTPAPCWSQWDPREQDARK